MIFLSLFKLNTKQVNDNNIPWTWASQVPGEGLLKSPKSKIQKTPKQKKNLIYRNAGFHELGDTELIVDN